MPQTGDTVAGPSIAAGAVGLFEELQWPSCGRWVPSPAEDQSNNLRVGTSSNQSRRR